MQIPMQAFHLFLQLDNIETEAPGNTGTAARVTNLLDARIDNMDINHA